MTNTTTALPFDLTDASTDWDDEPTAAELSPLPPMDDPRWFDLMASATRKETK